MTKLKICAKKMHSALFQPAAKRDLFSEHTLGGFGLFVIIVVILFPDPGL